MGFYGVHGVVGIKFFFIEFMGLCGLMFFMEFMGLWGLMSF